MAKSESNGMKAHLILELTVGPFCMGWNNRIEDRVEWKGKPSNKHRVMRKTGTDANSLKLDNSGGYRRFFR